MSSQSNKKQPQGGVKPDQNKGSKTQQIKPQPQIDTPHGFPFEHPDKSQLNKPENIKQPIMPDPQNQPQSGSAGDTSVPQGDCGAYSQVKTFKNLGICPPGTTGAKHDNPKGFNLPDKTSINKIFRENCDVVRTMSDRERRAIDAELANHVKDEKDRQAIYLGLALALADIGSSPQAVVIDFVQVGTEAIPLDQVLNIVRAHSTARRFARFYAKVVYQFMKDNNRPPDNWIGKGYPYEARFAAFDFFDAVSSGEAVEPEGGLKYVPTVAELRINNANKQVAIRRRDNIGTASTHVELTRGSTQQQPLPLTYTR